MPRESKSNAAWPDRLVEDPNKVPSLQVLRGYIGKSASNDHIRLYLSADLSQFVDIPKDDVKHQVDVPGEQDPLGAVIIWLDVQSRLVPGSVQQQAAVQAQHLYQQQLQQQQAAYGQAAYGQAPAAG